MATAAKTPLDLARDLLASKDNPTKMLTIARRGARLFPEEQLPGGETFASLAAKIEAGVESARTPAPKKATTRARKAAPQAAPQVESAPKVETTVLRLVHDGESQTAIFGVEKESPAHLALGSKRAGGLGWSFWPGNKSWYIRGSQGFAPNDDMISEAVARLESLKRDGVQLYRVDQQITRKRADGTVLPVKRTREQAAAWQHAYDAAMNGGTCTLSVGKGLCAGCGTTGLNVQTGRMIKGADGIPELKCGTCGGFDAPKAETVPEPVAEIAALVATLALPAATERENCHTCKTSVAVVDGQYALHSDPRGGACRAKRGVVIDDPIDDMIVIPVEGSEPLTIFPDETDPVAPRKPRRTRRTRKSAAADMGIVVTPATGLSVTFAMQSQLSGMQIKSTATEVRQELSRKISGVKIETRRDKATKRLVLTVVEGGEGVDADALTTKIVAAVKGVRGVVNQVHTA